MKSLEALKNIKREAGMPYFSTLYDIDMWHEDFETIKADLEVLEIIKKNTYRRDYNSLEPSITFIVPSWLSKEEFNKVKQWLEENEE